MKATQQLLTRDQFRAATFERDNHACVVCGAPAVDAHHILERRLFSDGGYYLNNGASVCANDHMECEMTHISVEQLRSLAKITKPVLPTHFYADLTYDKWGNVVLDNGRRLRGELFNDVSVQKILNQGGVLDLFDQHMKYPRTFHLPWSPGMHNDDRMMADVSMFEGRTVIVMEKLDGENTTMYSNHIHARSVASSNHPSRSWIKSFHARLQADIPPMWRVNVENMYAKHSILYRDLATYAYGFAIWDEDNYILPWATTLEWFQLLGITPCPVIFHGQYDQSAIDAAYRQYKKDRELTESHVGEKQIEGYVVRVDEPFHVGQFKNMVGKYVRKDHIITTQHWMHGQPITPNVLKDGHTGFEQPLNV